ncbi:MAG: kinase [Clostridia bacterium]|nr:kinase [Clostridia bacterium]
MPVEISEDRRNIPFAFILYEKEGRIGYRLKDFFDDEDVNDILKTYNVEEAVILRTWKPGKSDEWIGRENEEYKRDNLKLRSLSIESFFTQHFGQEEYMSFAAHIDRYLQEARDIIGYKTIKILSSLGFVSQKEAFEKELAEWDYGNYSFQIIYKDNEKISKYVKTLSNNTLSESTKQKIKKNYISNKLYMSMIGIKDYAESFITAEWLYNSLKGKKGFDYTSIISGYVKSIEQLIYKIILLNVDNNCKITINPNKSNDAKKNITLYKYVKEKGFVLYNDGSEYVKYLYMDLTSAQINYMDSSLGTFEYFLRNNKSIFVDETCSEIIAAMVGCFRDEYRNGYFHRHNLKNWDIVEKTRSNAIYLYYVLLGGSIIPDDKKTELGIRNEDEFDKLCMRIHDFNHYSVRFVFEYTDGKKEKMFYDFINNTVQTTPDGMEHYESLLFYKVKDFSTETIDKLNYNIKEDQKVFLSRNNLPERIYGVYNQIHRNKFGKDFERLL